MQDRVCISLYTIPFSVRCSLLLFRGLHGLDSRSWNWNIVFLFCFVFVFLWGLARPKLRFCCLYTQGRYYLAMCVQCLQEPSLCRQSSWRRHSELIEFIWPSIIFVTGKKKHEANMLAIIVKHVPLALKEVIKKLIILQVIFSTHGAMVMVKHFISHYQRVFFFFHELRLLLSEIVPGSIIITLIIKTLLHLFLTQTTAMLLAIDM